MIRLRSFPPIADRRSRVLILGSMPGPEALRRRQYYGFPGNQFWRLAADLLETPVPESYSAKVRMLRRGGIALWDTIQSCTRPGALDSRIRGARPNDIPGLLKRFPKIRSVFVNGRTAEAMLDRHHAGRIEVPAAYLPSSSPANAGISYAGKLRRWSKIKRWLVPRRAGP